MIHVGNGWGFLRHAFEEHIPWLVRLGSAWRVCNRQYFQISSAMRHFKESGHEESFREQVGIVGREDTKDN